MRFDYSNWSFGLNWFSKKPNLRPDQILKDNFAALLKEIAQTIQQDLSSVYLDLRHPLRTCVIKDAGITLCPLALLPNLKAMPQDLKPVDDLDPRLDTEKYWQKVSQWLAKDAKNVSKISNFEMQTFKHILLTLNNQPEALRRNLKASLTLQLKGYALQKKLTDLVFPIMTEVDVKNFKNFSIEFSKPIDPTMGWAADHTIAVCPLLILDLNTVPKELRPTGANDPKLYDLDFLQKLSDWIADEFQVPKQKVGFVEIAAIKTILKLKADATVFKKVFRAGLVHELGHVVLQHSHIMKAGCAQKQVEREADLFAVQKLHDGAEGIKIGCIALQETLKEVRASKLLSWKNQMLAKILITPKGNLVPLLFSHGSFEDRIKRAELAAGTNKKA